MPVVRLTSSVALVCALVLVGCRDEQADCPVGTPTANPPDIPDGSNTTNLTVSLSNPSPSNGLGVVTELQTDTGSITDPFARDTTYACPFDFAGDVEICVGAIYEGGDEQAAVASIAEKRRGPNVYFSDPFDCSATRCTVVTCPKVKNVCPEVSSLTIDPDELEEEETATVTVVAEDPDENPEPLMITLSARDGEIKDSGANTWTYECDPDVGGVIQICALASDGDPSCDVEHCSGVLCPGEPHENTCPIIESVTADPREVSSSDDPTTDVSVDATDPDRYPVPLRVEWSSETGVFADRFASQTTFTCGAPGPVEICVKANDGDSKCNERRCRTVQCPTDIPSNLCPMLFVINGVPRVIPEGEASTLVQTRGQDTDGVPVPLTLTLSALWGSFENTENIDQPFNVIEQNATYICDRPGLVEICVDATDGACTKTMCDTLVCPDSVANP